MHPLVDQDTLMAWTGYERPAALKKFLRDRGIRYLEGKGGRICTTLASVESAINGQAVNNERIDFDPE